MKKFRLLLQFTSFLILVTGSRALPEKGLSQESSRLSLIPYPESIQYLDGALQLNPRTVIRADPALSEIAGQLSSFLSESFDLELPIGSLADFQTGDIQLNLLELKRMSSDESYSLDVNDRGVTITASSPGGLFYGIQTFQQILVEVARPGHLLIPFLSVQDRPRFRWRGLMLDCSRTFQSLDYLRKTVDRMSKFKMNVLHLHLTDDQGWRIQIDRYPELTRKGSRFPKRFQQPRDTQGFYSKQELRELVEYASARGVTIVPEIEMPGHSTAVLACYPDLSCRGGPFEIFPFFRGSSVTTDILCAGNDKTFRFLKHVLEEVLELFPSEYIHVGGDEVPKDAWKECAKCQARIKREGLGDEEELQGWFMQEIGTWLRKRQRKFIGWDEILEGNVGMEAAVMSWRGIEGGIAGATSGHQVVMSPASHCYMDFSPIQTPLKKVYSYEPIPDGLTPDQAKLIMGVQGNHWSHIDRTPLRVDSMIYPRLLALAERAWSPAHVRSWKDFSSRLDPHLRHLREEGTTLWRPPIAEWSPRTGHQNLIIDVSDRVNSAGRYTLFFRKKAWADVKIKVAGVSLLSDDRLIASDNHAGIIGWDWDQPDYALEVHRYERDRVYRLDIKLESLREGGGEVYFDLAP